MVEWFDGEMGATGTTTTDEATGKTETHWRRDGDGHVTNVVVTTEKGSSQTRMAVSRTANQ